MNPDGTISWRQLRDEATQRLGSADIGSGPDGAMRDATRMVEAASGLSALEVHMHLDDLVTEGGVAHFDAMLTRRLTGEPLQYVIGSWSFRTLDLMVDQRVLIPRPETEIVVEFALRELDALGGSERRTAVVDLGTGSGAIGLSIAAERVRSSVWLTDASHDALAVATANIAGLGRAGARVSAVHGPWFEALPGELAGSVDMIISNPPYVADDAVLPPEVVDWEPTMALRSGGDGLDDIRTIIEGSGRWLVDAGVLVCEISPEQAETVARIARMSFAEVEVLDDLTGRQRALIARQPRRS